MSCWDSRFAMLIPSDASVIWHLFFWHLKDQVTLLWWANVSNSPKIKWLRSQNGQQQLSRYLDPFRFKVDLQTLELRAKKALVGLYTHNFNNSHPRVVKLEGLTFMSRSPNLWAAATHNVVTYNDDKARPRPRSMITLVPIQDYGNKTWW